jgi:hypothetical protein
MKKEQTAAIVGGIVFIVLLVLVWLQQFGNPLKQLFQ